MVNPPQVRTVKPKAKQPKVEACVRCYRPKMSDEICDSPGCVAYRKRAASKGLDKSR